MITEDFCSFEVAKLLKEKGFDELCIFKYNSEGVRMKAGVAIDEWQNSELDDDECSCVSHQMAMKWLREVHNIGIFPSTYTHISDRKVIHSYGTAIINLKTYELMTDSYLSNDTYEEAVEAALEYLLKNLI